MRLPRRFRYFVVPAICFFFGFLCHYLIQKIHFYKGVLKVLGTDVISLDALDQSLFGETVEFLIILVLSAAVNFDRREVIRETWANEIEEGAKVYFVVSGKGMPPKLQLLIKKEELEHQDLLILHGVEESFDSLTLKVLVSFMWAAGDSSLLGSISNTTLKRSFDKFSYLMKCDDDSYVRVDEIIKELGQSDGSFLYWGFFDGRARVRRTGKYKELGWNICDNYLPYALGGGYVLGSKPVHFISKNAADWRLYQNEDTSVGAWLSSMNGLQRKHDPRFDTEYLSRGCHNSYLVTHKQTSEQMRKIHNLLVTTQQPCSKEYRTRMSYKYDWSVLPSKCCVKNNPNIP